MILTMSFRVHRALIFCILVVFSLLLVYGPQPVDAATIGIPITITGLSPELSTRIIIDGKQQGSVAGGGTKTFNVDKKTPHTFEVEPEIKGNCVSYEGRSVCTRYSNPNNVWNLDVISTQNCQEVPVCYNQYWYCDYWGNCWWEPYCTYEKQCWATTELAEKGHTFVYGVEQQVIISDVHGQNMDTWQKMDSDVSLSANEIIPTVDESNVKERDIFVHWIVNGAPMEGRILTIKADRPLFIRAEYRTETQYRVRVSSEFGDPTTDSTEGWYAKGGRATISVQKEVPVEGFMGMLGGKSVFVAWRSPQGAESRDPTFTFTVQGPIAFQAEWKTDNSQPMTILAGMAVVIVIVVLVLALYRTGRLSRARAPSSKPTDSVTSLCASCGHQLTENQLFCPQCGQKRTE